MRKLFADRSGKIVAILMAALVLMAFTVKDFHVYMHDDLSSVSADVYGSSVSIDSSCYLCDFSFSPVTSSPTPVLLFFAGLLLSIAVTEVISGIGRKESFTSLRAPPAL